MKFIDFRRLNTPMINDFMMNILASLIYTVSTQLIAYPALSRIVSSSEYGLLLTLMGVANAFGVAFGNPLNNTRILLQDKYNAKSIKGDFNIIFSVAIIFNVIIVSFSASLITGGFDTKVIGVVVISLLVLFRAYFTVGYRIIINYKKYLVSSVFSLIGYLIGLSVTYLTGFWILTFIIGEFLSCVYVYFTNRDLINEKFNKTTLYQSTHKKYLLIMFAALMSTLMTYLDRFFLFPFLGSEVVSTYNVASFLGKTGGIILGPIAGVLLTYYAKEAEISIKDFYRRFFVFFVISLVFYTGILLVGIPITKFLYPTIFESAIPYFAIANLASTIFILGNTLQPTLLRYCDARWQPLIQLLYIIVYLSTGIYGMKEYGLLGFCYALLFSNIFKVVIMLLAVINTFRKKK